MHDIKQEHIRDSQTAVKPTEYSLLAQSSIEVVVPKLSQVIGS
jgi:hypothetical protein